jgi:phosphate transport system substrate-binding protein
MVCQNRAHGRECPTLFHTIHLRIPTAILCATLAVTAFAGADELISLRGAQVAAEPVTAAAAQIKKDTGLEFRVVTEGGSGGAVGGIGDDVVDVALLSRKITPREHAFWPDRKFSEVQMGMQALLIVVPEPVWKSGVRALTKDQVRDIYEGRVKNWKALGGEDRKITFYNRDVRSSAWELFMVFLYDDTRKALPSVAEVLVEPSDVTTGVEYNGGSISVLEYGVPRAAGIHALGIREADGSVVEPTPVNIASGRYELARPLIIATARKPAGKVRRFVEFMLSAEGQAFVKKTGHISNAELAEKK